MTGYLGMDLPRFLGIVRARKWLIAAIVVGAGALALAASLTQSDRYRASADLVFGKTTNADAIVSGVGHGARVARWPGRRTRANAPSAAWCTCSAPGQASWSRVLATRSR